MKKFKNLELIQKNKTQLEDYLSDFHDEKSKEFRKLFNDDDFNCGRSVFKLKMKSMLAMPKIGKNTLKYWTSRGWSKEESEKLRIKRKSDPKKSPMNKNYWISRGLTIDEAEYKIKSFRKNNIEYWLERGYSKDESEKKRKEFQIKNNKKFIIKYKTNKDFKKEIDSKRNNNLNYWLEKGYSQEKAKEKLSNRQRTFSKEICIKKHGKIKGEKIFKDRQLKWQKSLRDSNYDGHFGKGVKIENRMEKYNVEKLINSITLKNKDLFIRLFKECDTIENFINAYSDTFNKCDEISLYKIIKPIKKLKILHTFYNTTENHMMSLIIPKIARSKSMYSYYSWFNNHVCRSDGEYIIANFLFRNNINYIYEKKYENSVYICDFYLPKYDLYIEYLGMMKKNRNPYKTKLNYLNKSNINHISSDNIDEIKINIMRYVNSSNKRHI